MLYKAIVCGGTFDLLHKGHKSFLTQIFNISNNVVIGLTSDSYIGKFKEETFEDFDTRRENLIEFISEKKALEKVKIVTIDDIYGPLLNKRFTADAIAVTNETKNGAVQINEKRKSLGLAPINTLVIKMDRAMDGGLISSTRIRNGEIDRSGKLFLNPNWIGKALVLPNSLRDELHKPFGKLISAFPKNIDPDKTITVGDITTLKFNNHNVGQLLSIIDFIVERHKRFNRLSELGFPNNLEVIKVNNLAGQISWDLFQAIINSLKSRQRKIILVNGEEDLAVLPAILTVPLDFKIYYGQPSEGLVEIEVTEEIKEKAYVLASKFNLS